MKIGSKLKYFDENYRIDAFIYSIAEIHDRVDTEEVNRLVTELN